MTATDLDAPAICFSIFEGLLDLFPGVGRTRHLALQLSSPTIRLSSDNLIVTHCERRVLGARQYQPLMVAVGMLDST
ncbi:hypothetical protein [Massilia sp. CCM 8734]|uniref:hypothetical protein n=1 Tax=Massilia sp. CCM 8734 TaxID=2609283 RepID=UPI0014245EFA|nr:hypothetical protein [Massilia sp. CCM 8734]